jgi:hypothetical protein
MCGGEGETQTPEVERQPKAPSSGVCVRLDQGVTNVMGVTDDGPVRHLAPVLCHRSQQVGAVHGRPHLVGLQECKGTVHVPSKEGVPPGRRVAGSRATHL